MATIKFSNGATVNFNGTPTQADINEVAKTPAVANYKAPTFKSNVIQDNQGAAKDLATKGIPNLMNSITTPFESVAAAPVQGIARLAGLPDPYAKGMPNLDSLGSSAQDTANNPSQNNPIAPFTKAGLLVKTGQAGEIASNVISPEVAGAMKLAVLAGVSGLSQSLAAGNTDPATLAKDTVSAAPWGFGLGLLGKGISLGANGLRSLSGADPQVIHELQNAPVSLINDYADTAIGHEGNIRTPTAHAAAEQAAQTRASILVKQAIPQAGKAVGDARKAQGALPIIVASQDATTPALQGAQAVPTLVSNINSKLEDMTGYGFGQANNVEEGLPGLPGTAGEATPIIRQVPGSQKEISDADMARLQHLQGQLDLLNSKPTVGVASDVIHNLEQDVNRNAPAFGQPQTPVNGALKYAIHAINDTIKGASPELASALENYSNLMGVKEQVADAAGKDFGNASLMMRRVLSGDKSKDAISALDGLTKATQPFVDATDHSARTDLVTHAVLADWATNNFGGASAKTLLKQYTSEGSSFFGYAKGIVATLMKEGIKHLTPNARDYATAVASGEPYSLNPVTRLTEAVLKSAETQPLIGAIAKKIKGGVPAAEAVVENLIKMAIFHSLTAPGSNSQVSPQFPPQNQVPFGGGASSPTPPSQSAPQPQAPLSQSSPAQNRSLASGVNQASNTALKGLSAPTSGQAMSASLRAGLSAGNGLGARGLS